MENTLEPRRSARDRKKPTIYTVDPKDERESNLSDDEEFQPKKKKSHTTNLSTEKNGRPLKKRSSLRSLLHSDDDDVSSSSIFESVCRPNVALASTVEEWIERFKANEDAGTIEILNFLLHSCGATTAYADPTTTVDALDINDMVEEVMEDLRSSDQDYPLVSKSKIYSHFADNFIEFWGKLFRSCCEGMIYDSSFVETCINWISSLSSAEARAVRHTATIAAYVIATVFAEEADDLREKIEKGERHEAAEVKKTKTATKSRKLSLLQNTNSTLIHQKKVLDDHIQAIFNGIFVHRYRDVMVEIRIESVTSLGDWIQAYPEQFLHDNYLKYLAWNLNDKDAAVRDAVLQVLVKLYEDAKYYEKMELFTTRFLPRYIEMCNDVDVNNVIHAIHLVEAIDRANLIDSETDVEYVERLVFDDRSETIRRSAASFVLLQYEAFTPLESMEKKNCTSAEKQQHLAMQIIALVEFAEERIAENFYLADYLVDAFWGKEDFVALGEWSLMSQILLDDQRELNSIQQTILLRILLSSLRKMSLEIPKKKKTKSSLSLSREGNLKLEESMSSLMSSLPSLLKKYKSDIVKLTLLVRLPRYMTLSHMDDVRLSKCFSQLLRRLKETFLNHGDAEFIETCVKTLEHLSSQEYAAANESQSLVHEIIVELGDCLLGLFREEEKKSTISTTSSRTTPRTTTLDVDEEFAFALSLRRMRCLNGFVDVRLTLGDELANTLHNKTVNFIRSKVKNGNSKVVSEALQWIFIGFLWQYKALIHSAQQMDTNNMHNNTKITTEKKSKRDVGIVIEDLQVSCALLSEKRTELVELLESCLAMDSSSAWSSDPTEEEDDVQAAAFRIFCDLRCLCMMRLEKNTIMSSLAWNPSKNLIFLVQQYFETQMESLSIHKEDSSKQNSKTAAAGVAEKHHHHHSLPTTSRLTTSRLTTSLLTTSSSQDDQDFSNIQKQTKKSDQIQSEILIALSNACLYNPQSKKEAAAILSYLYGSGQQCKDVVRAFAKEVKATAPVRYLEIQMTCLRQGYKQWIEDNAAQDSTTTTTTNNHCGILRGLAKNLSTTMGVGKVPSQIRQPFLKFIQEGIRFALEKQQNFSFLELMKPYLGHVDKSGIQSLSTFFLECIEGFSNEMVCKFQEEDEKKEEQRELGWKSVLDFRASLLNNNNKKINLPAPSLMTPRSSYSPMDSPPISSSSRKRSLSINEEDEDLEDQNRMPGSIVSRSKRSRKSDLASVPEEETSEPENNFVATHRKRGTTTMSDSDDEDEQGIHPTHSRQKKIRRLMPMNEE